MFVKKFERHGIELPTALFREGAEIGQSVDLAARIAQGTEAR